MPRKILFEACVEKIDDAAAAEEGGADRIELCINLDIGGTTPPLDMTAEVRRLLRIPIHLLVRPRGGDFHYSDEEFAAMKRDIESAKELGIEGVVIGMLTSDKLVDTPRMGALVRLARPMSVTFHRAFDEVKDPFLALDKILELGIDRLLTSGLKKSAEEGIPLLKKLRLAAAGRIALLPGGGINEKNARTIIERTGVNEIHASLRAAGNTQGVSYSERVRSFIDSLP